MAIWRKKACILWLYILRAAQAVPQFLALTYTFAAVNLEQTDAFERKWMTLKPAPHRFLIFI